MKLGYLAMMVGVALMGITQANAVERDNQAVLAKVAYSPVEVTEIVPGSIVPDQQAKIASRLMGYIRNLSIQVGQSVKEGQLLFAVDPTDINSQIRQAQSAVAQAKAALVDAKADYDRFSKLYKEQSVPQQQFEKMKLQYQVAQENLSAAQAGLEQAQGQMRYADVKAPFDGVVVQKLAVSGDLAAPGNPVLVLENRQLMSVQVDVSADLYKALKLGDVARVMVEGRDGVLNATISNLVASANPMTRTHTVKLALNGNSAGVNSGAFVRVAFHRSERKALLVPPNAVMSRGGVVGVFVVNDQDKAAYRMVRTGLVHGDMLEIQSGLEAGERVVVKSQLPMLNGDHVVVGGQ